MITCGDKQQSRLFMLLMGWRMLHMQIVATISSLSAGPGTRANIDEFTITTKRGIEEVGGADKGRR